MASICSKYFTMEFQIGELSEEHQKYTHTHTHTHHMHTRAQSQKDSQLHKLFKKVHMSHKYFLALKGVPSFVE